MSTQGPSPNIAPGARLQITALLCVFAALCAYLFRGVQHSGDGASYVLQAVQGDPFERSLHVGYLVFLKGWVWLASLAGIAPATAANLLAVLCTALALWLVTDIARDLLDDLAGAGQQAPWFPFAALAAPLSLLCAEVSWEASLFAELYGPLATLSLAAAFALRRDRDVLAACLLLGAGLVHPGAWMLLPGLLLATGRKADRRSVRLVAMAFVPWLICLALLAPEWWSGGRGLLSLPAFERSAWQSMQVAWRLLSQDLGLGAAPVLLGAAWVVADPTLLRARRWFFGVLLVALGAALGVDRYTDNCGQLPALWMSCCLAPLACGWLRALARPAAQRWAALIWLVILFLCIADATSKHDAHARKALRQHEARILLCPKGQGQHDSWRETQLRHLACLNAEAP